MKKNKKNIVLTLQTSMEGSFNGGEAREATRLTHDHHHHHHHRRHHHHHRHHQVDSRPTGEAERLNGTRGAGFQGAEKCLVNFFVMPSTIEHV